MFTAVFSIQCWATAGKHHCLDYRGYRKLLAICAIFIFQKLWGCGFQKYVKFFQVFISHVPKYNHVSTYITLLPLFVYMFVCSFCSP